MKKLLVLFSVFLLVSCNSAKKNEYQKPLGGQMMRENLKKVDYVVRNELSQNLLSELSSLSRKNYDEIDKIVTDKFMDLLKKGKLKGNQFNEFINFVIELYKQHSNQMTLENLLNALN